MERLSVLVTSMHLSDQARRILHDGGADVIFMPDPINEQTLIEHLTSTPISGVILRGSQPFTARVLAAAPHLKIVAKHGAGVDSVDVDEATRRGIAVMVAGGANAEAVAEHSLAPMLSLIRELPRLDRSVRRGVWATTGFQGRDFRDSVLGIVGYGSIGRSVARMATALGARVVVLKRSSGAAAGDLETETELDALLRRVDILSLHCPLTEQTRGLIGKRELALMKSGAILINTSRGPVVDEPALIEALRTGRLSGAGLDTFAVEPIDPQNPLLTLDNVVCTPHIAGVTRNAVIRMSTIAATNILEYLRGEPIDRVNLVNPTVLERPRT